MRKLERFDGRLVTASPVWRELHFGARRLPESRRRATLERDLHELSWALEIVPYSSAAAEWQAAERARLEGAGLSSSFVDGQIAAIAATGGFVLVTRNISAFEPFEGLSVENWFHTP